MSGVARRKAPPAEAEPDAKTRLLEAAGPLFAEKGYEQTSVREICRAAGQRNIGAVQFHFGSKENLYEQTLQYAFRCRLSKLPQPEWPAGTVPAEKLRGFIRLLVTHMVDDQWQPWEMQLLMRELSRPSPAGAALVRDFIRPVYQGLWGLLREALGGRADESRLLLIGFSIVGQCFYHRIGRPVIRLVAGEAEAATYTSAVLADHIANFSLAALGLDVLTASPLPMPKGGKRR